MTIAYHDISETPDKYPPKLLQNLHHATLPTAGTNLCDGIIVSGAPDTLGYLQVFYQASIATKLTLTRTVETNTDEIVLNGGSDLIAKQELRETIHVTPGETINFKASVTGGAYLLRIGTFIQR